MNDPIYTRITHRGIVVDLPPEEVEGENWTEGANVHFRDKATERSGGAALWADPLLGDGVLYLMSVADEAVQYWLYATKTGIYVTEGINHFDITPVGGITETQEYEGAWTGCLLNGIPCLNNQKDVPWYWDLNTANPMQPLPGWDVTWRCRALRAHKYHLFALGMTIGAEVFPELLYWSEGARPGAIPQEWVPTSSNDAGDAQCSATQGNIIDGERLRDEFIVYKSYSVYVLRYVGGTITFALSKLFLTQGIQSTNCVAEVGGWHYVFSGDTCFRHDGQNMEHLANHKIKNALIGSIPPDYKDACLVAARHSTDEIWFCIPEADEQLLGKAYVYNMLTGDWGIRLLPFVAYIERGIVGLENNEFNWDQQTDTWEESVRKWNSSAYSATADSLVMADYTNNRLLAVDQSSDIAGEPVAAYVERTGMDLGDFTRRKLVTQLIPRITGEAGEQISIRVGGQTLFDDPIRWSDDVLFTVGQDVAVECFIEGRLIAVRFASSGGKPWKLHKYTLKWVEQGIY